ncbi:hypothetical protein CHS0354_034297 [Potamilus streckersoni]|uniref:Uncharacterized protein n=1 Tax=Potamilus streckersoni TaxID=2493646 RepID=A0AAE0WA76_9BIVA|nr:hypothetical protein CHS0354_034297 [Potamilus streckersoni]
MASEFEEEIKWPESKPDTLQDLCVFYAVNNISRILRSTGIYLESPHLNTQNDHNSSQSTETSMNSIDTSVGSGHITLPTVLGNRLLHYLINYCLPDFSYLNINRIEDIQYFFCRKYIYVSRIELLCGNIQRRVPPSIIESLKEHQLEEISMRCALFDDGVDAFRPVIQSQVNSLKKLILPDAPCDTIRQIFFSKEDCDFEKSVTKADNVRMAQKRILNHTGTPACQLAYPDNSGKPKWEVLAFPKLSSLHLYEYDSYLDTSCVGNVLLQHKNLSSFGYRTVSSQGLSYPCMEPIPMALLDSFSCLRGLTSLCLTQCSLESDAFECISILQNLRHLDLSYCSLESELDNMDDHKHLVKLLQQLSKLVSLDISYTRFGGIIQSSKKHGYGEPEEIAVLPGFKGRQFEFLGLWQVFPDVGRLQGIPANKITGKANEKQIINALYAYQNNIPLLKEVLAHIMNTDMYEPKDPITVLSGLQLCLRTLQSRNEESLVLHSFLQVFRHCYKHISQTQCREILELMLIFINKNLHPQDEQRRNSVNQEDEIVITPDHSVMSCMLVTLSTGYFAHTAIYSYCFERYVDTLCSVINSCSSILPTTYIMRGVKLLLEACRVRQDYKNLIGEMGIIKRLLKIMSKMTDCLVIEDLVDDVAILTEQLYSFLKVAWSILWSLTDEIPENSERFCSCGGVLLFIKTVESLQQQPDLDLAKKITGTLNNVSEVQRLRTHLMNEEFITALRWFLLHSDAEEGKIETSYHCVYILVYLLSDGFDNWTVDSISPQDVLDEVRTVMALWEVNVKRNVRYRSLFPVLALLECQSLPKEEAQYLAAWSLCNLTTVKMELYCDMLRRENGEEIIKRVCDSLGDDQQKTKTLLADVMQNISKYFAVKPT